MRLSRHDGMDVVSVCLGEDPRGDVSGIKCSTASGEDLVRIPLIHNGSRGITNSLMRNFALKLAVRLYVPENSPSIEVVSVGRSGVSYKQQGVLLKHYHNLVEQQRSYVGILKHERNNIMARIKQGSVYSV